MPVKQYRPTSAGRRRSSVSDYAELTPGAKPTKRLLSRINKTGGRNQSGKITCRHIGGGNKQRYRTIDFKRNKDDVPAKVASIEYDPNRSCHIALLNYADGDKRYILAPLGLKLGERILSGQKVEPKLGNAMPLAGIPVGMEIHNVEMTPGRGGQLVRTAGGVARLAAKDGDWAHLSLPSGELRMVRVECRATIGQIGNLDHQNVRIGKAGRNRHMGRRPTVRGVAMNPVAHPMGGGEGRSGGGRHPCSPTGKLAKGGKTRSPRKVSSKRIIRRRKSRRYGLSVV